MLEPLLIDIQYPKKIKWSLKESFIHPYKTTIFIGQMVWFLRIKNKVSKFMRLSVIY